jgi:hypothetical protein
VQTPLKHCWSVQELAGMVVVLQEVPLALLDVVQTPVAGLQAKVWHEVSALQVRGV